MAYNYTQSDFTKQAEEELRRLAAQRANFDQTYDHTKDAGWAAADEQLKKDARIAGANAVGRMGNRIGAISTSMQNASDSIYADALKNSQNLIGQYRDAAYSKLLNEYNLANQNYWNSSNFDMQKYAQQLAQENADRAYNYQLGRDKVTDAQWQKQYDLSKDAAKTPTSKTSSGSSVPSYVLKQLELIDNDDDLKRRVKGLVESGAISDVQGNGLLAAYGLFGQNTTSTPQVVAPAVGFNYYDKKGGGVRAIK